MRLRVRCYIGRHGLLLGKNSYLCTPEILSVAQLAEQMTLNHRVEGSNPSGETGTKQCTGALLCDLRLTINDS
jgi:hypothetical protein